MPKRIHSIHRVVPNKTRIAPHGIVKRTHPDIPEHITRHVDRLYLAVRHTLGSTESIRKRAFLAMLKLYYKWESKETLSSYYDKIVKAKDKDYMIRQCSKRLELTYHDKVMQLFGCMDTNGDCGIDSKEFKGALGFLEDKEGDLFDADALFAKADKDKNGVLDVIEFYDLVASTPLLLNHFEDILNNTELYNYKQDLKKRYRLFSRNVSNRRPSMTDLKKHSEILSSDVPLYGVAPPEQMSQPYRRYYGHTINPDEGAQSLTALQSAPPPSDR